MWAIVIDVCPVRMAAAAAGGAAGVTMVFVAGLGDVAAILAAQPANRAAVWRWAVAIAVQCGQQPLHRSEIAAALRPGPTAVARIARIAAVGRIADPLADIHVAAALATDAIAPEPGKDAALLRAIGARLARSGTAVVAAAVPFDGPGKREAAGGAAGQAAGIAASLLAAATGGGQRADNERNKQTSRHGGLPSRSLKCAV